MATTRGRCSAPDPNPGLSAALDQGKPSSFRHGGVLSPASRLGYNRVDVPANGEGVMSITVEAIYENGVLKPAHPLPFMEREHVQVFVRRSNQLADQTYGM